MQYMEFNMHKSVAITGYFLESLITCKSLTLIDDIQNQFNHQYYQTLLFTMRITAFRLSRLIFQMLRYYK